MTKRPLLFGVVAFVIGEWTGFDRYMTMGLGMVVVFFLGFTMWNRKRRRQTMPFLYLFLGICFYLGILNGMRCRMTDPLMESLQTIEQDTVNCEMVGRVLRLEYKEDQSIIILKTERIRGENFDSMSPHMFKLYVNDKQNVDDEQTDNEIIERKAEGNDGGLSVGNRIRCTATLRILREPTNPGEFNAKQYYQARGMDGLAYSDGVNVIDNSVYPIRQKLTEMTRKGQRIFEQCMSKRNAEYMGAILLGNTGELDTQSKRLFQRNGIAHILAISALHISIIGGMIYKLLRKKGLPYWLAGSVAIALLFLYGWMTGFSGSTIRAVIMFVMALVGDIIGRTYDMLTAVGVSCLLILLESPYRLSDAGFILSFGAVITLGAVVPKVLEWMEPLKKGKLQWRFLTGLVTGVVLQVMTAPLSIYFYYDYPVYSVVLNLIVVPLMTPLVVFGFLGLFLYPIFPWIGHIILLPCESILNLFSFLCRGAEQLPGAVWHVGAITIWDILLYYAVLACVGLCIKNRKFRIGSIIVGIYMFLLIAFCEHTLTVVLLDVGQGDCMYMKTPNQMSLLFDGGSSSRSHIGEYVITPAVKYYGSGRLDYVFVSHMDEDHVNGIEEMMGLMEEGGIQIGTLVVPEPACKDLEFQELIANAQLLGIEVKYISCGEVLYIDEVEITCLYPNDMQLSGNNSSMVLSVTYQAFDLLLTGDLEIEGEQKLQMLSGDQLRSSYDVLKVAHHGSSGSSSEDFLQRVSPVCSIISCGKHNRYGHPHEELLERLEEYGTDVFRTDECGAIEIRVKGNRAKMLVWK